MEMGGVDVGLEAGTSGSSDYNNQPAVGPAMLDGPDMAKVSHGSKINRQKYTAQFGARHSNKSSIARVTNSSCIKLLEALQGMDKDFARDTMAKLLENLMKGDNPKRNLRVRRRQSLSLQKKQRAKRKLEIEQQIN